VDVRKSSRRGILEFFMLRFFLLRPFRCEICDCRYFGLSFAVRIKEKESASKLKFLTFPAQIADGREKSTGNSMGKNPVCVDPGNSGAEGVVKPASAQDPSRSDEGNVERP